MDYSRIQKDFEQMSKIALEAERQWKESAEHAAQEMEAAEFHDTSASVLSDLEGLGAMRRAQDQAQLDMVAELKAINERLDVERQARISAEKHQEKREHKNFWIALISCVASVVAAVVGILTFLNVRP